MNGFNYSDMRPMMRIETSVSEQGLLDKKMFPSWIVLVYGILETLKYLKIIPIMTVNILGCIMGALSFFYTFKKEGIYIKYILFFIIYTTMGVLSFFYNGNIDFQELLWPLFFGGISLLIITFRIDERFAIVPVYFFAVMMLFMFLRYGSIYDLSFSESRNYSSVYLLSFYSIYIIVREKQKKTNIEIVPLVVVMVCSFLSAGRGGMISFALFAALALLYSCAKNIGRVTKQSIKIHNLTIVLFVLIAIAVLIYSGIIARVFEMIKNMLTYYLSKGMNSSSREAIWSDYLGQIVLSPMSFLFGPQIGGTYILEMFNWNLHNSYLMMYARYGTVVFIMIAILMVKSGVYVVKQKRWILLIVLITVFIRCFTDCIAFNGVMDITWYYLLFFWDYEKNG